jgi:lipopolysaccharide export system permease protein
MLRILDRYIIRETIMPTFIGLLVFSFVLEIPVILREGEELIVKGASWSVVAKVLVTLLPQSLGVTIPMALLLGLLIALGRLSADRESVALQACGVSLYRLLRPVAFLSFIAFGATLYVMIVLVPAANQAFRELTFRVVSSRAEGDIKPRVFFADFPGIVLYVRDVAADGWHDVFVADTKDPNEPVVYVARRGRVRIDAQKRTVEMYLLDGSSHRTHANDPQKYDVSQFGQSVISLDPESVFPREGAVLKGAAEMTIAELRQKILELKKAGDRTHNEEIAIHQKFSIPVACLVFGLIATALGITTRRDGKLASFVVGIGVVFAYYIMLYLPRSLAKGGLLQGTLAAWLPNIVLGAVGVWVFVRRASYAERPLRISLPSLRRAPAEPRDAAARAGGARRRGRVVVVIRVPQIEIPRPKIIDLYVTRLSMRIIGLAVLALLGLFYISSFIDLSDKLFKGTATGRMVLQYLWFATPEFLYYIIPMSILIATLVTIGALTKNSELIVMRACGVSLYRVAAPLLLIALVGSSVLFLLDERVLGYSKRRSDELQQIMRGRTPRTLDAQNQKWIIARNGSIYHYAFFDPRRNEMNGLSIFSFDQAFRLVRRTDVNRAVYAGGTDGGSHWRAVNGWTREFAGEAVKYLPARELTVAMEEPAYFKSERNDAERLSYTQLRAYIRDLKTAGFNAVPSTVQLYRKLAFPFVTIIMTLIAVPFAVTTGRRGALYGIGIGIVLAIVYWITISIFGAIGGAGLVPPVLAAWTPNLLFGAAAGYLLLTVRT